MQDLASASATCAANSPRKGLWPWPMNQRIKDGLVQAGYPPVDVTATMEQLFGPIPASCRGGGGPPPVVPVPPTNVTTTLQGTQVRVTWTDTQTVHTGYAVERRALTAPYTELSAQIPKEARSYTDSSPVAWRGELLRGVCAWTCWAERL